jgi:cadmium resistance protein CadD (predicted permease)
MRTSDFALIEHICIALGVVLLIGAALCYSQVNNQMLPNSLIAAYLNYTVILGVFGAISLIVGLAFLWTPKQVAQQANIQLPHSQIAQKRYCRFCGSENKSDSSYCEKCGKPLE